jgi:hypothetical protein
VQIRSIWRHQVFGWRVAIWMVCHAAAQQQGDGRRAGYRVARLSDQVAISVRAE